jgi:hypothetical protein
LSDPLCYHDVVIGLRFEGIMGVTVTRVASDPLSIKCRICGRMAPRGAKLCEQCKLALKRARQVPTVVTQFLPLAISGPVSHGRDRGHRRASPARSAHRFAAPSVPGSTWGVCAAIVIFGLALAATGYFAVQEIKDDPDRAGVAAVPFHEPVAEPRSAPATEPTETLVLRAPIERNETARDAYAGAARALPPALTAPKPVSRIAVADTKAARPGMPSSDARPQTPSGKSGAAQGPTYAARVSTPMANVAPAAIGDEPSAPDRWQAMSVELARCSRENFIAGVLCDERARWQYCEGYWGQVPQCPAASRVDGGR